MVKREWEEIILESRDQKVELLDETRPTILTDILEKNMSPVDLFKTFFRDDIIAKICLETKRYADQKGFHGFSVIPDDMYKYLAIILLSGYSPVPSRRCYWETRMDTNKPLVTNAFSRNKFESIHRFFHLNDNSVIDKSDKIYKIRPLIDHLNKVSQECISPLGKYVSVDEAMEPYYGRHHMKQFIKGKPIRFGFKLWCLCTFDGYLVKFDVYTGAGDKVEGKSLGSSVTEKLCLSFLEQGSTIFLDNFFTSITLLETLSANRFYCVGPVLKNNQKTRQLSAKIKELYVK
nr:unnamed protein product [Callosobruchus chinensis]